MARISIWDMDFYHKKSFLPNPELMKISSYHKQLGDLINFITEEYHISMKYDKFYILRDKQTTPRLTSKIMDAPNVFLLGKGFKYQPNYYKISEVIAAVRPDYLLYPEKEKNSYYNANIVQFYHDGKRLKLKQPFENTKKHHKKTLVIDKDFWDHSLEDIEITLTELLEYKNIAFSAPIKLEILIKNEKIQKIFLELNFSQGTRFKFKNNYGSTYEDALILINFYKKLKEMHPHVFLGRIPIRSMLYNHWDEPETGIIDLERCLKIMDAAKKEKVHILIVAPERRKFETPYWYYFEILESWCRYFDDLSYVELMLHSATKRMKIPWYAILNNSLKWSLPNINFLLHLMTRRKEMIENYGYRRWGDNMLESELIIWEEVEKYSGGIKYVEEETKNDNETDN